MPSSLTMVLPIALVCSTRPPVSVLVRAPPRSLGVFLGSMGSPASHEASSGVSACVQGGFACPAAYALSRGRPEPRPATLLRHPVGRIRSGGYGNVRLLCIGYAFRPRLSSRLTLGGLALPRKPWVYGGGVSRPLSLLMPAFSLPCRSTEGRPRLRRGMESSPTTDKTVRRFGAVLSPVYCRRMSTRPVSCYALFKCMAASKPTSWLSGQTHILCHSARTWGP